MSNIPVKKVEKAVARVIGPICKAVAYPSGGMGIWKDESNRTVIRAGGVFISTSTPEVSDEAISTFVNKKMSMVDVASEEEISHGKKCLESGLGEGWVLPSNFSDLWDRTVYAASNDPTRPTMVGVLVESDRLVATDGHRLSLTQAEFGPLPWGAKQLVLEPLVGVLAKAVAKVHGATLALHTADVSADYVQYSAKVSFPDGTNLVVLNVVTTLVGEDGEAIKGGRFPDYRPLFRPREEDTATAHLSAKEVELLIDQLKKPPFPVTVAKAAIENKVAVLVGQGLAVRFKADGAEQQIVEIPVIKAECISKKMKPVAFNRTYLREALEATVGDVVLRLALPLDPMEITDSTDSCALIMPMRED